MNSKYHNEAKNKWQNTKEYQEYNKKTQDYKDEKWEMLSKEMNEILKSFSILLSSKLQYQDFRVQELVMKLKNHISMNYYSCNNEMLLNLGKMYVEDSRFKDKIDSNGCGTALFICQAIQYFCRKELNC